MRNDVEMCRKVVSNVMEMTKKTLNLLLILVITNGEFPSKSVPVSGSARTRV